MSLAALSSSQTSRAAAPLSFTTLVGPSRQRPPQPEASRIESALLATVAHELRNPLTSLRLSLDMLVAEFDELEPQSALRLIQRAQRSATWLQGMADNLTSAAAVEEGCLEVRTETVDLAECIEDAVGLVHGLLEQRGQCVRYTGSDESEPILVKGDHARITQIIANLLTNATRYSVDGDELEVHVSVTSQHVRVRVTDHGPGIAPEDQERIFGAWVRGKSSTVGAGASSGGLGLGLSIVQNLVQRLGGRVGVDSAPGEGATFWFTLARALLIDGTA